MSNLKYETMSHPIRRCYALPESQHVSFLVDTNVYKDIASYIYLLTIKPTDEVINKYTNKQQYIGWGYNPDKNNFARAEKRNDLPKNAIPVYVISDPLIDSVMQAVITYEDSDNQPDDLIIKVNTVLLLGWYSKMLISYRFINDTYAQTQMTNRQYRRYIYGCLDHEFLHLRQAYMTKSGKNALLRHIHLKKDIQNYIDMLSLDDEEYECVRELFYYFSKAEMEANISSTGRAFEDPELRQEAKDEMLRQLCNKNDPTDEERAQCEFMMKDYSVDFIRVCVRLTYDFNCVDVINDLVRKYKASKNIQDAVKEIDRHFRLHIFEYGIDEAAAKYVSRVMAAIYGVLVKFNKSLCESKHFSNIELYRKIFYNNCFENVR